MLQCTLMLKNNTQRTTLLHCETVSKDFSKSLSEFYLAT